MKSKRQPARIIGLAFLSFYLCWIIFVGTFSSHELLIGIIAALLAVAGLYMINLQYPATFQPTLKELLSLWSIPWYLLCDTWEIVALATKDILGVQTAKSLFQVVPFRAGNKEDPPATARRVLAVIYTTMTPSTLVLGVNTSDQKLLLHRLEPGPVSRVTEDLGART